MKRALFACAAMMAITGGMLAEELEELQPGDGDITLIEDTGENPDIDSLLGNPESGLFDNFVNGVWQDPYATPVTSSPGSGNNYSYLVTGGTPTRNLFSASAGHSLDVFRLSMPGAMLNLAPVDPVPEPGTWAAIIAVGAIGTSVWFRRRVA